MSATAELIADGGGAATDAEFFRSAPFLAAEGATHTLRIASAQGELLAPLIVREIPGSELLDGCSPYGYPGAAAVPPAPLDPAAVDWSATGLVSVFVRDRVGPQPCFASLPRSRVLIADPGSPPRTRSSDRNQLNRNARLGYVTERIEGPATTAEQRVAFERLYSETMRRVEAPERYFFGQEYFDSVLASDRSWLVLTSAPDSSPAAAAIVVESDAYLHYFLSGTAGEFRRHAPAKSAMAEMLAMSTERGLPLNLGGGARPGDSLEEFKRGFANAEAPWHTHEIVCDPEAYAKLSAGREDAGFFPAYRAE